MIFEKNSTRTRFSFDAAIRQLGGASDPGHRRRTCSSAAARPIEDTARVLSRMVDAIMIRAVSHDDIEDCRERLAHHAGVPVINGLTDKQPPLPDPGRPDDAGGAFAARSKARTIAWIGDGNNVCASFIHAAAKFGFRLVVAGPRRYWPSEDDLAKAPGLIAVSEDMHAAARGADCVIADGWVSMGHADYQERVYAFAPYAVDEALMAIAAPHAVFLHCLPAHRGEEVTAGVIDGPQSLVWDEAENRIHVQKSILAWCFGTLG